MLLFVVPRPLCPLCSRPDGHEVIFRALSSQPQLWVTAAIFAATEEAWVDLRGRAERGRIERERGAGVSVGGGRGRLCPTSMTTSTSRLATRKLKTPYRKALLTSLEDYECFGGFGVSLVV